MLYLLVEQAKFQMTGVQTTLHYLKKKSSRKKLPLCQLTSLKDLTDALPDGSSVSESACSPSVVILVGLSTQWVLSQIAEANRIHIYPIVISNLNPRICHLTFGLAAMDIHAAMKKVLIYLRQLGCIHPALYGVNPASTGDSWRSDCFLLEGFSPDDIFVCVNSFQETFQAFLSSINRYDSVICTYDYTAVSLLRHLEMTAPRQLGRLKIISFGDSHLSAACVPSITTISHNRHAAVEEALALYERLLRSPELSTVHILLKSHLQIRETTSNEAFTPQQLIQEPAYSPTPNLLYNEQELREITTVEQMLLQCDDTDLQIIESLLLYRSLSDICQYCHLSETPIKRRIRILQKLCGVSDKSHLTQLLQKYFQRQTP